MKQQLPEMLRLAGPVILAELGWMFMGVVDTIMVGSLGPTAIGAVSVGHIFIDLMAIVGIGLLLGLDTLVSQIFWRGEYARLRSFSLAGSVPCDCLHADRHGIRVCGGAGPGTRGCPVRRREPRRSLRSESSVELSAPSSLRGVPQIPPGDLTRAAGYVRPGHSEHCQRHRELASHPELWGGGRRLGHHRIALIHGAVPGVVAIWREPALLRLIPRPDLDRIRELLRLGIPAAGQILLEVGVFATSTLLAGRFAPEALAAHHILLNIAGTTFMVPLGMSSAGAVAVGHAIGRKDLHAARQSGWLAICLGGGFMTVAAIVFLLIPRPLISLFTTNSDVLKIAIPLLSVAAVFQIFDGLQVVTTGVLRGAGDTRTPMLVNLMGHWLLGLPTGYFLAFVLGYGVTGIWWGLSVGLIVVGCVLLFAWSRLRLRSSSAAPSQCTACNEC